MSSISTNLQNAMLGTIGFTGAINNGAILCYSGTQPTSANAAASGTLLGTITLGGGTWAAGNTSNGLVPASPNGGIVAIPGGAVWQAMSGGAVAAGTITWARWVGNASDPQTTDSSFLYPRLDMSVGTTSGDLQLTVINVIIGTPIIVQSLNVHF
jgi:hypothetical protein